MNCDKCGREMFFDTEDSVWRHETLSDGSEPVDCPMVTKTGRILTEADVAALADEAERGYDVTHLHHKRRPRRR